MKKVVFTCHTMYQVFVAYIISRLKYSRQDIQNKELSIADKCHMSSNTKEYELILMIEGYIPLKELASRAEKSGVWDAVYTIFEYGDLDDVARWIQQRNLCDADILHLGAWGGKAANQLTRMVSEDAVIIINEEGTASYSWMEGYKNWIERYFTEKGKTFVNNIAIDKIKAGMFFDSRISVNEDLDITAEDIRLEEFIELLKEGSELEVMNDLFCCDIQKIPENIRNILFDQNLSMQEVSGNDFQQAYLSAIADSFQNEKFYIKLHPSEHCREKFKGIGSAVMLEANETPWEVIFINLLMKKDFRKDGFVILTYCSSAAFNSILIARAFGIKVHVVLLYKAVNHLADKKILLDERVIQRYLDYYDEVYIGEDIGSICQFLCRMKGKKCNKYEINRKIDSWFRHFYFSSCVPSRSFSLQDIRGRVIIYGAGDYGKKLYEQIRLQKEIQVVAWVDSHYMRYDNSIYRILEPEKLKDVEFDYVLIAVRDQNVKNQIEETIRSVCGKEIPMKWCHKYE